MTTKNERKIEVIVLLESFCFVFKFGFVLVDVEDIDTVDED